MTSLKRKTITGFSWTFAQQFSSQIIQFIISVILARMLMPEDFGLVGMLAVFIALGQSLVDGGLSQSLIRTERTKAEDISTVFIFNLAASVIMFAVLFVCAPYIASFYNRDELTSILRVYSLSFIINAFSTIQLTLLTKSLNFRTQLIATLPSLIVGGLSGIVFAYNGFGVWSLVYMSLIRSTLMSIQLWIRSPWKPSLRFSKESFSHHFHFGYKLALSGVLDTIFKNIYQIVIGRFFVPEQVGFYMKANSIKQLPVSNLSTSLNKVTYPIFARITNDDARLKAAYKEIMTMVIFVIAPCLCLLGAVAEDLFVILLTKKWLPAATYFQILCLAGILYPIHSYNLNILKVKGRSDLFLRLEIVKKAILVVILSVTIPQGITWMLWGQVVSSCISFIINTHYSGKFLDYPAVEQAIDILPAITLAMFSGFVSWYTNGLLHEALHVHPIIIMALSLSAGAATYIVCAIILKFKALKTAQQLILKR